jgi:cytochrome b561
LSHFVHWGLYLMLLLVPIGGYLAISYGRYLDVFGLPLPAVTVQDKEFSKELFEFHELGATMLLALVGLHIIAAGYHRFVRKDRVVERMLPRRYV